jgi:hypothetical protein
MILSNSVLLLYFQGLLTTPAGLQNPVDLVRRAVLKHVDIDTRIQ